jgi:hypothetical protein
LVEEEVIGLPRHVQALFESTAKNSSTESSFSVCLNLAALAGVHAESAAGAVTDLLNGVNGCVFAYLLRGMYMQCL